MHRRPDDKTFDVERWAVAALAVVPPGCELAPEPGIRRDPAGGYGIAQGFDHAGREDVLVVAKADAEEGQVHPLRAERLIVILGHPGVAESLLLRIERDFDMNMLGRTRQKSGGDYLRRTKLVELKLLEIRFLRSAVEQGEYENSDRTVTHQQC
jgi:hypothetical protein